jgi:sugar transferase (PEP-CTERM/EpsH1 system associated)
LALSADKVTHVAHLLYRFYTGGMENVVVQLINGLPPSEFRHTVIALTDADPEFLARIKSPGVEVIQLHKAPGQPFRLYPAMFTLLRRLKPDVLHSCNLAALEFAPVALLAGVPRRVHAEHGWDVADPVGANFRYRLLRKAYKFSVNHFVAVSAQLYNYLRKAIKVPLCKMSLVPNGVDTERFRPHRNEDLTPPGYPFRRLDHWVIGTVGRLAAIKNQILLAEAFVHLVKSNPQGGERLRLAVVGDGPLTLSVRAVLNKANLIDRVWMPGGRTDIAEILRMLDCFVLPSLAEGTSCTLQEAMATALPIVATDVGGNADLLGDGRFGYLSPSNDVVALSNAIKTIFNDAKPARQKATLARIEAVESFSLSGVVEAYRHLFSSVGRRTS